jgi:hypothetical protein
MLVIVLCAIRCSRNEEAALGTEFAKITSPSPILEAIGHPLSGDSTMILNRIVAATACLALSATTVSAQQGPLFTVQGDSKLLIRVASERTETTGEKYASPWMPGSELRVLWPQNLVNQADDAFLTAWFNYDMALGYFGSLRNAERVAGTEQLSRDFTREFGTTLDQILPPQHRELYIQLGMLDRCYNPFSDPRVIQDLRLSRQQREQFLRLSQEYNIRINQLCQGLGAVPSNLNQQFYDLHITIGDQLNTILNGRQREQWPVIVSQPIEDQTGVRVSRR